MKKKFFLLVLTLFFLAGCSFPEVTQPGVSHPIQVQPMPVQITPDQPKACTEEAKVCPDGSAVGRTGPNCEFATCPAETQTGCTCTEWYIQEGEVCNPTCYYSTPKCLMPSVQCE